MASVALGLSNRMIRLENISKQNGKQLVFIEASASLLKGEKAGLVGPNGAGKTTLFRMIIGEEQPDEGQVAVDKGVSIGYFSQDVGEMGGRPVVAEVMNGAGPVSELMAEMALLEAAMADPEQSDQMDAIIERYGEVQGRFQELDGYSLDGRAREVLDGLGFSQEMMEGDVGALSGGWKMRVALARILLMSPDVLLLDEPSNHLDLESLIWLESFLNGYQGAILMTSHDREFMNRIVNKIVEIDGGALTSYTGDYAFYEAARAQEAVRREAAYARQQAMLQKEMRFVDRFKAQAAKAAQVQSRVKKLDKIEKIEPPRRIVERTFDFKPPARSGDDAVKIEGLRKAYGARVVHNGISLVIRRGERWAVMGENGAGKTTLLKMIAGALEPDAGQCSLGANVKLGYFAQHQMETIDSSATVLSELQAHFPTLGIGVLRNAGGAFGFHGDDMEKPVSVLSGGELARVALLKILFDAPNVLVLDEPTNHLDVATKHALVKALAAYEGTIVFVSHDRSFLRAVANRVLELTAQGPHSYGGPYDEYVAASGRPAPGMRVT